MFSNILKTVRILAILFALTACNLLSAAPAATSQPTATQPTVPQPTSPPLPTQPPPTIPTNTSTPTAPNPTQAQPTQISPTQAPATQPPTPSLPAPQPGTLFAVILVKEGDVLNIRTNPGADQPVLETRQPGDNHVEATGESVMVGNDRWLGVWGANAPGWANAYYLTERVDPAGFCSDPAVGRLLDQFKVAIHAKDGEALSALISPAHGLSLQYLRGGNIANYSPDEARFLFTSTYEMNWGLHPGSGQAVKGTFHEEVLPKLEEVLNAPNREDTCNKPKLGGATYEYQWPKEYANINFYSLYKPGSPSVDLDWRTWLIGVEYVDGNPYLFSLVHLMWEP